MVRARRFHRQGLGSIPGRGTKVLQAEWHGQKYFLKKLKIKLHKIIMVIIFFNG